MPTIDPAPLLRTVGLQVGWRGRALHPPVDLTVRPGELWALVGRNGAGKSTWFRTVLGLQPAVAGQVERAEDLRVAYLPQRAALDELVPLAAWQVVAMGELRGWSFLRPALPVPSVRVREALELVDAEELARRTFRTLSEGEKQRVLMARLVASEARIAFLDEPTAAMDAVAEREATRLLDRLRRRTGMAVVVVSHHLRVAREQADFVLFLDDALDLALVGRPEEVFSHPAFRRRYGEEAS